VRRYFRQILVDFRARRYIDLYASVAVTVAAAIALLVGADLSGDLRWSILFAAIGILLLRSMAQLRPAVRKELLLDRNAYAEFPVDQELAQARDVWLFAPVGSNFLTGERCEILRRGPLSHSDGSVRVILLEEIKIEDPRGAQLDSLLDYPVQRAAEAIHEMHGRMNAMGQWKVAGSFAFGTVSINPGFSMVAIDPGRRTSSLTVEFHGFRNSSISSRMHIRLTREDERWYSYWIGQFEAMWGAMSEFKAQRSTG